MKNRIKWLDFYYFLTWKSHEKYEYIYVKYLNKEISFKEIISDFRFLIELKKFNKEELNDSLLNFISEKIKNILKL